MKRNKIKNIRKCQESDTKKYMVMAAVITFGIAAAVCVHLSSRMQGRLAEGTRLYRNEWGEGNYFVTLRAVTDLEEGEIDYEVKERVLTKEERLILKEQVTVLLPELIIGSNENLMFVREDLDLVTQISGCPFSIAWQSSDYGRIRTDGKVNTDDLPQDGEEVILTAVLSYGMESWEQEIKVRLLPQVMTRKEQYLLQVETEVLKKDRQYEDSREIFLPETIDGSVVTWKEKTDDSSFLLVIAGFLGAMLVSPLTDRYLKHKERLRREELEKSYSEFVSKLQLYMGAGLTVKNAFMKMGRDYQLEREQTGKKRFLYEEVLTAGYQFINGKPEAVVYQEWGKRCKGMRYRKLGFLLTSHLRQGNDKILSLLSEETDRALEERKHAARKLGEEAGTKLLFPMMLMLIMVMFLILLPVFSDFGNM